MDTPFILQVGEMPFGLLFFPSSLEIFKGKGTREAIAQGIKQRLAAQADQGQSSFVLAIILSSGVKGGRVELDTKKCDLLLHNS